MKCTIDIPEGPGVSAQGGMPLEFVERAKLTAIYVNGERINGRLVIVVAAVEASIPEIDKLETNDEEELHDVVLTAAAELVKLEMLRRLGDGTNDS